MALIITATDFTTLADNAVHYACNLCVAQNAALEVIHSYMPAVFFNDAIMPVIPANDGQATGAEKMSELIDELKASYPTLAVSGRTVYGDIIDELEEYTGENKKPLLIVVGNSSTHEHPLWLDSTMLDAFSTLLYPVLAIPAGVTYQPIEQLCFAYDNKLQGNEAALIQVRELALLLRARLHVLHAAEGKENDDISSDAKNILLPAAPEYHLYNDENTDEAMQDFMSTHFIDWIAILAHRHSFWQKLFHKGHAQSIANHMHVPILALHPNEA